MHGGDREGQGGRREGGRWEGKEKEGAEGGREGLVGNCETGVLEKVQSGGIKGVRWCEFASAGRILLRFSAHHEVDGQEQGAAAAAGMEIY